MLILLLCHSHGYPLCSNAPLYAGNVRFRAHAETLGLGIEYEEGAGGHQWACWDAQIQRVLAWLPGVGQR